MEFTPEELHVRRATIDHTDSVVRILIASKEASFPFEKRLGRQRQWPADGWYIRRQSRWGRTSN
jgi:hypothetical protein